MRTGFHPFGTERTAEDLGRVKRLSKRAGITKRISLHSLRHSFINAALNAGVPLRDVQEAASHADPRTTMRYDRAHQSLDCSTTSIVAACRDVTRLTATVGSREPRYGQWYGFG